MGCPITNVECGHTFCSNCIESLSFCPVDNMVIKTLDINFQLKGELDELLCYCRYAVYYDDYGHLSLRQDGGCNMLVNYGNKQAHEAMCKYNPATYTRAPPAEFDDNDCHIMSDLDDDQYDADSDDVEKEVDMDEENESMSFQSIPSPLSTQSFHSTSSSDINVHPLSLDLDNAKFVVGQQSLPSSPVPKSTSESMNSSSSSSSSSEESSYESFPEVPVPKETPHEEEMTVTRRQTLEKCACPNKDSGCYYFGNHTSLQHHLDNECEAQKLKNRIRLLEDTLEKKNNEITELKFNQLLETSIHPQPHSGTIIPYSISNYVFDVFRVIKEQVVVGINKVRTWFTSKISSLF
ncbi:hypothetical protein SAMD00019534_086720 [Acytostelium subglobosum LB1]|uniref:hypothetical protein n=1 Tax=Acytostelium subglobosum LB1 TaxID=1410327 RepID=UPI0006451D49|nr:hypothetical protein SAMD00019534_086720 [Acytostelium subglobosum LB1]GAM25497.1 hypothetical protein SAMD00019534_086720 [Acytostelium subglobosum LB1]|eukprot:XP_012751483.1 hypothetical protein SAMD00019534_086720 [Acytostelium subglobosum LB1]